jgi:hypothetical protein
MEDMEAEVVTVWEMGDTAVATMGGGMSGGFGGGIGGNFFNQMQP